MPKKNKKNSSNLSEKINITRQMILKGKYCSAITAEIIINIFLQLVKMLVYYVCLDRFSEVMKAAKANDVKVRGYVSCVVGCPYEGNVSCVVGCPYEGKC